MCSLIATNNKDKKQQRNMTQRYRLGTHMDDKGMATLTEQTDHAGDKGHLVNDPPRPAKAQKTVKFSKTPEMESCEVCGGSFMKGRGLKIHQGKTKCKSVLENRNSKSMKRGSQDPHHSGTTNNIVHDRPTLSLSKASQREVKGSRNVKTTQLNSSMIGMTDNQVENKGKKCKRKVDPRCKDIRNYGSRTKESKEPSVKVNEGKDSKHGKIIPDNKKGHEIEASIISSKDSSRDKDGPQDHCVKTPNAAKEDSHKDDYKRLSFEINSGPPGDILSRHYIALSREDYRSLTGKNWLNDNIINEYFELIRERNERDNLSNVITFDTHAFARLDFDFEEGFKVISERWITADLTKVDLVLIPIHKDDHWTLLTVYPKEQQIEYLDSILGTRYSSRAPKIFKDFFNRYFEGKGKLAAFKTSIKKDAPLQTNGYDCGVITCLNAEKVARGEYVRAQYDTSKARIEMMMEIFEGKIMTNNTLNIRNLLEEATYKQPKGQCKPKRVSNKEAKKDKSSNNRGNGKNPQKRIEGSSSKDVRKLPLNLPRANSKEWERLDQDLTTLLKTIYSPADKKAMSHPKIIYEMCKERFGVKEKKINCTHGPSKRQVKCAKLRKEIKTLKKAYQEAPDCEKAKIKTLNQEKLRSLRLAKRAESIRKHRKKFSNNCQAFLSQPYQFSRKIIAPKPTGKLQSTKEEVEEHLNKVHSCQDEVKREYLDGLQQYDEPEYEFEDNVPSFNEFLLKLRGTRSKSAPGPNGVPYLVYKRCPGVAKQLWYYLRELWKKNTISDTWREAEGVFIPKEEGATTVDKFRTISLLNVEGKLFFSLKADRITSFLLKNSFIDPSIQKGGIPGVSGCLEHTAILSQLIREAKREKKNLVVTWLDIANAYGSIPHDVIIKALESANIPIRTRELVENYYKEVKIRFTTSNFTTKWQKVEKGIITGCTLSVPLFALSMAWLVESVKNETKGPKTSSGQRQVNSRLLMDDINTTTETVPQTKHLLGKLAEKLRWAGLSLKIPKCWSLVIYQGQVQKREIKIDGIAMRPLEEIPSRYLGKGYNSECGDKEQIRQVERDLKQDLKKIEKCKLPGRYKCWMVENMLLKRISWPLSMYNIPLTKIEDMQKKITQSLKRWLKVPNSLSSSCFYSTTAKLRLPFSSLVEEFKVSKARNLVTFEESADPCISKANISVDGGRKANTPAEVKEAKSRLQMQEITGIPNKGREGLGMRGRKYYSKSTKKGKRDLIVQNVKDKEEEERRINMTGLSKQGGHMKWEVPQKYLKQNDLIKMPEARLSFLIKVVHDLLPTPANKSKWFDQEEKCKLCGQEGTLHHILSNCKVALKQGRYKWRHDKVLNKIADSIERRIRVNVICKTGATTGITFLKEGEKVKKDSGRKNSGNYLTTADDWKLKVDLDKRLTIPKDVTVTNLRPDITLMSEKTKQFGIVELTVPSEERVEISGELKKLKYEKIAQEARVNGWKVRVWAVEVGCRGFPAASLASFLKEIGFKGMQKKKTLEDIGKTAEQASLSLWKASFFEKWGKLKD